MAVVVQSSATSTLTGGTTFQVLMPATVDPGDLLVVVMGLSPNGAYNPQSDTLPAGWMPIHANQVNDAILAACKIADGTEDGTTVNFHVGTSTVSGQACAMRITGYDPVALIHTVEHGDNTSSSGGLGGTATQLKFPALSNGLSDPGLLIEGLMSGNAATATWNMGGDLTVVRNTNANSTAFGVGHKQLAGGATEAAVTRTATATVSGANVGVRFLVAPAGSTRLSAPTVIGSAHVAPPTGIPSTAVVTTTAAVATDETLFVACAGYANYTDDNWSISDDHGTVYLLDAESFDPDGSSAFVNTRLYRAPAAGIPSGTHITVTYSNDGVSLLAQRVVAFKVKNIDLSAPNASILTSSSSINSSGRIYKPNRTVQKSLVLVVEGVNTYNLNSTFTGNYSDIVGRPVIPGREEVTDLALWTAKAGGLRVLYADPVSGLDEKMTLVVGWAVATRTGSDGFGLGVTRPGSSTAYLPSRTSGIAAVYGEIVNNLKPGFIDGQGDAIPVFDLGAPAQKPNTYPFKMIL